MLTMAGELMERLAEAGATAPGQRRPRPGPPLPLIPPGDTTGTVRRRDAAAGA